MYLDQTPHNKRVKLQPDLLIKQNNLWNNGKMSYDYNLIVFSSTHFWQNIKMFYEHKRRFEKNTF